MFLNQSRTPNTSTATYPDGTPNPFNQPYVTASEETRLAIDVLKQSYQKLRDRRSDPLDRLIAFINRASAFELIENLHKLNDFRAWRMQLRYHQDTLDGDRFSTLIRNFEHRVTQLDEQDGVKFTTYRGFFPYSEYPCNELYRDFYCYSLEIPSEQHFCISLIHSTTGCHNYAATLFVSVAHNGHVTAQDRELAQLYCDWLNGLGPQSTPSSADIPSSEQDHNQQASSTATAPTHRNYYPAPTFELLVSSTLQSWRDRIPNHYRTFAKARRLLWCQQFDHYSKALSAASLEVYKKPTTDTKLAYTKAIFNLWVLLDDYHRLLDQATAIARYCFPLEPDEILFDFDKTYHLPNLVQLEELYHSSKRRRRDVIISSHDLTYRAPVRYNYEDVVHTSFLWPKGGFRIDLHFVQDSTTIYCYFTTDYQLFRIDVLDAPDDFNQDTFCAELCDFTASEDYYGYPLADGISPLENELYELECLGLGLTKNSVFLPKDLEFEPRQEFLIPEDANPEPHSPDQAPTPLITYQTLECPDNTPTKLLRRYGNCASNCKIPSLINSRV